MPFIIVKKMMLTVYYIIAMSLTLKIKNINNAHECQSLENAMLLSRRETICISL